MVWHTTKDTPEIGRAVLIVKNIYCDKYDTELRVQMGVYRRVYYNGVRTYWGICTAGDKELPVWVNDIWGWAYETDLCESVFKEINMKENQ